MSESQNFKLIIEDDEGRRSIVPIELGHVSIGRLENNTIRLNERNVSRQHARIVKDNGAVFAEDLGSYNGVFINGDRIKGKHEIREGDLIKIGDFHLELRGEGLSRRTEETTQRTVLPDREDTKTDVRIVNVEPTSVVPAPTAPPKARPARDEDEELDRHEATAIIRLDAPELQGPAKQAALAGEKAKLICVSTQFAGHEYDIVKTEVSIGRTDENDIAIDHRSVSRHHARISLVNGRYRLIDLKSANGTLVNGEQYAQAELKRGDLVELGHVKFRFVPPGESYTLTPDEAAAVKAPRAAPAAAAPSGLSVAEAAAISTPLGKLAGLPLLPIGVGAVLVVAALLIVILATGGNEPTTAPALPEATNGRAGPGGSAEGQALIGRAQVALQQRRWQQASTLAVAALELDPTLQQARDVAAQAQLELKAQASYEAATSAISRSDWGAAWRSLGEIPEQSVYKTQSLGLYEQVKGALIADAIAKARAAVDASDWDRATEHVDELARIDPMRPDLAQLRADIERGRTVVARPAPAPQRPSGKTQPRREPPSKTSGSASSSPTPTPAPQPASTPPASAKDAGTLYSEGAAALKGGDLQGAINSFAECVNVDAAYAKCYRALGIAYAKSGNGAKAARYYKQYLKVLPSAPDADQVRQLLEQYETAP